MSKSHLTRTVLTTLALAAFLAVAGPVSQAAANNGGGDNFMHHVSATCGYHSISVDIDASGTYNGQYVATRVLARFEGGTWQAVGGWKTTRIDPMRTINAYFGNTYQQQITVDVDTQLLSTTGGYREVGVEFYWWNGSAWDNYDLFVADYFQEVLPSIYTVNYYSGPSARCLT